MQPFGRPAARAVWRHGRLGLDLATRPNMVRDRFANAMAPNACMRCHVRAIVFPARFYSSQPPPRGPEKLPSDPIADLISSTPSTKPTPNSAKTTASPSDASVPHELPSTSESRRHQLTQAFSNVMDGLQTRVLNATQTINDITGYTGIDAIKAENEAMEAALADAQRRVRAARQAYKTSNTKRATTQREVTTLLARKDSWSPLDLERFTELYRADHVMEGEVISAQESLTEAESDEQKLSQKLNAGILKRYHEEQIWSDRIRRASTWGTWGLMGMNFLLFVVLQVFAEPWRRKRLVKGVVEQEIQALEEVRTELSSLKAVLAKKDEPEAPALEAEAVEPGVVGSTKGQPLAFAKRAPNTWREWKELVEEPDKWRPFMGYLFGDKKLDMKMRDASILAIQGALTGAAVVGSFAMLFGRR